MSCSVQLSLHDYRHVSFHIHGQLYTLVKMFEGLVFSWHLYSRIYISCFLYIFSPCNSGPHSLPCEYCIHFLHLHHTIYQCYIKYCCITGQHCYHEQSSWDQKKDKPKIKSTLWRCNNKLANFFVNMIYFHLWCHLLPYKLHVILASANTYSPDAC